MRAEGVFKLPSLFLIGGYRVFFWSNEGFEPVHVHVSHGAPSKNSAKVWLTEAGGTILASNEARIPQKDMNELLDVIAAQHSFICDEWKRFYLVDEVSFYC